MCMYLERIITRSVSSPIFNSLLRSVTVRLLSIGRLGVLGALINFPFDAVEKSEISKIIKIFLFLETDDNFEDFSLRNIEERLADMNKLDLIHYIKAASGSVII